MYGQPLEPAKTKFLTFLDDGTQINLYNNGGVGLLLIDMEDDGNDNIGEVNHPDFETYWDIASEGLFSLSDNAPFTTLEEAKAWCESIGMVYTSDLFDEL